MLWESEWKNNKFFGSFWLLQSAYQLLLSQPAERLVISELALPILNLNSNHGILIGHIFPKQRYNISFIALELESNAKFFSAPRINNQIV